MKKGLERGISTPDLAEIIANAREIAKDLEPDSPAMKAVRQNSELRDRKLAERGTIVRLPSLQALLT